MFRQFGASLLLGLFLLFQYGWLHSLYGVGVGVLILIVALYGVSVFLAQVVAMAAYSLTSMSPRRRTLAKGLVYGVLGAFAAAVAARAALAPGGLTLASLVDAADSPLFHLMPVAGWTAAILSGAMTGDLAMLGAYAALTAAFLAAVVVLIARYDHDYYEDVLRTAEISHSAITAQKEGRVADSAPANVKVGQGGAGAAAGARARSISSTAWRTAARGAICSRPHRWCSPPSSSALPFSCAKTARCRCFSWPCTCRCLPRRSRALAAN